MKLTKNYPLLFVIALLIFAAGLYFGKYGNMSKSMPVQTYQEQAVVDETASWKTYTNSTYAYSIQYPLEWTVKDITKVYDDLTVLDAQMFNDDNSPTISDKEVSIKLSNNVDIEKIKQRTSGGDAGMGYSNKVTTENFQGKEIVKVINKSFSYESSGGTKDTGTDYVIYIPVDNNFFTLRGNIMNKQVLDQMVNTFKPSSQTGENYLPSVVLLAREDLAKKSGVNPTTIAVEAIQENEWKNSSLDCPKPGQAYSQVITPGYRVLFYLNKGGSIEYHTDKNNTYINCFSK